MKKIVQKNLCKDKFKVQRRSSPLAKPSCAKFIKSLFKQLKK